MLDKDVRMATTTPEIRRTQGRSVAQTWQEAQQHETCPRSELNDLLGRADGFAAEELRRLLCSAFLLGRMNAEEFYQSLKENDLVNPQDAFMMAYATGVFALMAETEKSATVRVTKLAEVD
jgi:hypothetical protein